MPTNDISKRIIQHNNDAQKHNDSIYQANLQEGHIDSRKQATIKRWHSNDNISDFLTDTPDLIHIQNEVEFHFQKILDALVIDTEHDHNTQNTAKRVAKMYVREIFVGRYEPMPAITTFPNQGYDQMLISGPIKIKSMCAHHMMPIVGHCWIGCKPDDRVVGLSKFNRLVRWISRRPQIQEEMTEQIANLIEEQLKPKGVAVLIKAEHFCLTHRGVEEHESDMLTSVMRGEFRTESSLKKEFLNLVSNMKGQ